jgi:D-glycero-alpha-D-manno-heptose 1-phosphate guanylyltransferase
MEAIVLAGGRGTRLRSLVSDVPKPMADINGTPFLTHILERLARAGVARAVLSVGYKHEAITNHFGESYRGMRLVYAVEREPLGTGGALALSLAQVRGEAAFVLNGDTYFEVPLRELAAHHTDGGCDLTMALKRLHDVERYGTVVVDGGRVVRFEAKARRAEGFINGGVYVMRRDLLRDAAPGARFSFEADFLPAHLGEFRVCPYPCEGYFIDIGVPEDYLRALRELKSVQPAAHSA